jgi:hypothetical protein
MVSRGYGRLIFLSTGLSRRARDGMITLGTAKAALDQFVRYVALELAPHGITANLVAPATVEGTTVTEQLAPEQVAGEEGFSVLSWVGDHFQIPTLGIAVDPTRIPLDNPALQALVRANQRALLTIAEQPQLAVDYIASFLGRLTRDEVQRYYERYIGPYFTSDGRVDLNVAQQAVDAVATELGVAAASVDQMYQPAL